MPSSNSPYHRNVASRLHINLVAVLGAALLLSAGGVTAAAQTSARVWYETFFSGGNLDTGVYTINVSGSGAATNPTDIISTPSASFVDLDGLAIDPSYGHYFVANFYNNTQGNSVNQIIEGNTDGIGTPSVIYTSGNSGEDAIVGLALDSRNGNLYFAVTDGNIPGSNTTTGIYYINARGTGTQTATKLVNLSSGAQAPSDIAIDTTNNLIFYTDGVPGLSGVEEVGVASLTSGAVINSDLVGYTPSGDEEPYGIAVDPATDTLYWTTIDNASNSGDAVYSATYTAGGSVTLSGFETLAALSTAQMPIGIDLDVPAGGYYVVTANGDESVENESNEVLWGSSLTGPEALVNVYSIPKANTDEFVPGEAIIVETPPVVTASGTVTFVDGESAIAIDSDATVSDADGYSLASATVSIAGGRGTGDALNFTNQNGITGNFSSGTLTLTGAASAADYQTALESVTFSTTSTSTTARTIDWTVNDGILSSATTTSTVDVHVEPTVTAGATVTFDDGGSPVALDSGLAVSDASSSTLASATVMIGSGAGTGDKLNFTNQNGITGSFSAGMLTMTGTATVAHYQAALESITFSTTSTSATPRIIDWIVSDGVASSATANSTVDVHVAPTVTAGATATFDGDGSPVALDPGLTVNDASSSTLASATVSIASGFNTGDTLSFTNQNGITGSFSAGTLSLTGTASVALYQAALESITFSTTSTSTVTRTIDWTVNDGVLSSATATSTVNVMLPPAITSASGTTFTVGSAGSFTVTGSGNPAPTFSETGNLPNGVTLASSGALTGTPAAGTGGTYPLTITAANGIGTNATQSFMLTVDQAPAITSGTSTTFTVGAMGTFTVSATGYPLPTFSETGTLPAGVTLSTAGVLSGVPALGTAGSYPFTITAGNGVGTNATESFTLKVNPPANYVVTTNTDDATGTPSNCPVPSTGNTCTLRDALAAAGAAGAGTITFDPTAFASAQTITLTNGALSIPTDTSITGPTTGSGASLANLVTVSGNNASTVFTVASGVTGASIANVIVSNGNAGSGTGGGLYNDGALTVAGSSITGSSAENGGGVYNDASGTLTITVSTLSGNQAQDGAGIANAGGTLNVYRSTISGNIAAQYAGGIADNGTTTLADSTVAGNQAALSGGGIASQTGTTALANSIVSGNTGASSVADDIDSASGNGYTNLGGNLVGTVNGGAAQPGPIQLGPLANYGGPTQTMVPEPGSPAICGGTLANLNLSGLTTDQRGYPNQNLTYPGYSSSTPCVDAGAVQTNYAIGFTTQPPSTAEEGVALSPAPVVGLTESGAPIAVSAGTVTMSDTASLLTGTLSETFASGVASFGNLVIPAPTTGDTLNATLALTPSINLTAQASQSITVGGIAGVTLSTTDLSFPSTDVGSTRTLPVTVTNSGTTNLTVSVIGNSGVNPTDFSHTSNCGGHPIAPGDYCTIQVIFTPAAAGPYSATLTITDSATGSPHTVTLSGNGTAPTVTLSTTGLSFPSTDVGTTSTLPVTVTNSGSTNLTVNVIGNSGVNPTDFSHTSNCGGYQITPGNSCTIQVNFTPPAAGPFSATLNITDNATGSPQTVTLSGNGLAPTVTLSTTGLSFPSTDVGTTSTLPVTVTNSGTTNLTVSVIGNSGVNPTDFSHTSNCGGYPIAPGAYCTIQVNFTPGAAGPFSATLNITDNATGSPQTVTLSGNGTAPAVMLSTTGLSFPSTKVGSTSTLPVTVTNTGTANLTVSVIGNSGANPTDFSHTSNCGGHAIAPGDYCTIQVYFTPGAAGPLSATLNITDNATGSPQTVTLGGTGQ